MREISKDVIEGMRRNQTKQHEDMLNKTKTKDFASQTADNPGL